MSSLLASRMLEFSVGIAMLHLDRSFMTRVHANLAPGVVSGGLRRRKLLWFFGSP